MSSKIRYGGAVMTKTYLVTGGAGFIGANFVKYMLQNYKKEIKMIVLDKLTYAGNIENIRKELSEIEFIKGDICNGELVENIFLKNKIDYVVNFAAESHVDKSIENPSIFLKTNILGTQNLLENAKFAWAIDKDAKGYPIYRKGVRFLQVSTDEVYGTLTKDYSEAKKLHLEDELKEIASNRKDLKKYGDDFFVEKTPLDPRSPYSASKASADMLVKAYSETYNMPVNITRCSNNYGPYQFPEKLIPVVIGNVFKGEKIPVYGDGKNIRDWLYVGDHVKAIDLVLQKAKSGEVYNIGGYNEEENINIVKLIIDMVYEFFSENMEYADKLSVNIENINYNLINYVQDRLGHDRRYAINPKKIAEELAWYPKTTFEEGIKKTVEWYIHNINWVENIKNGKYKNYERILSLNKNMLS